MLIFDFSEVYEYKDNKKTEKVRGYKAEFLSLQMVAKKDFVLMLSFQSRCAC